jgi:putative two-component system response regulator
MLRIEGYEVVQASSGQSGIEAFLAHSPDAVLLDVLMPDLDGFQVTERIRAMDGEVRTPIILVTGLDRVEDRVEGLRRGADDFVTKPVISADLITRVTAHLRIRDLTQELVRRAHDLEDQVQERTKILTDVTVGLVAALERVNLMHDEDTGNHIRRVCEFSRVLSEEAGLPPAECQQIGLWSSLHDVGKVGTPIEILAKPGRLTDSEFDIIKRHPQFGCDLLRIAKAPTVACNIALTHHERWDGSGYPNGLVANAIPREGRIVAVADVYDALTHTRSYKQAWTVDRVEALFREQRGKHFDPEVVDAYFSVADRFAEIQAQLADAPPGDVNADATS